MKWIFLALLMITSISEAPFPFKFPKINTQTIEGKVISEAYFKQGKTMVVLMHLGCPPAMVLINDLQKIEREKLNGYQILIITENTKNQVEQFNSDDMNLWSGLRTTFGTDKITMDVIAECEKENIIIENDNVVIGQQCRKLSRKLFTKSSPSIYFVDENRKIKRVEKGYSAQSNLSYLEELLLDFGS